MKNKIIKYSLITLVIIVFVSVFYYSINYFNVRIKTSDLSNKQQIEHLLAQKFNESPEKIELTIEKENDNYMVGQTSVGEGGIRVMAAKVGGVWILIDTGNAFANCDNLRKYSFPTEFLPSYCDCNDIFYKEPYSERIRPKYCD